MDSADSSARRGGRRIPILQFATLALGLQAGGNSSIGQACVANLSPCTPVTSSSAPQVDYLAPLVAALAEPRHCTSQQCRTPGKKRVCRNYRHQSRPCIGPARRRGHLHARVEEVPAFSREETYLFLWTAPNGTYRILGWTQGAFRIRKDQTTGLESVTQDSAAAPLFDPVTRRFRHGGIRNLPIAVFQVKLKRVELYCRRPHTVRWRIQDRKTPVGHSYTVYAEPLDGAITDRQCNANAMPQRHH